MIELINAQILDRAIAKAKAEAKNLFVQTTKAPRQYKVTNRAKNVTYLVNFYIQQGRRFAVCNCRAGQNDMACKHVAAAAGLNMYLAQNGMLNRKSVSLV